MSTNKGKQVVIAVVALLVGAPILAVCGLVFWLYAKTLFSTSKRPEIEQILAQAETKAAEMDTRWRKAMVTAAELPAGAVVCSVQDFRLPERGATKKALGLEGASGPDLDQVMRDVAAAQAKSGASNEMVINRKNLSASKSPMALHVAHLVQSIRWDLENGNKEHEDLLARANALVAPSFWTRDLTVVIDLKLDPSLEKPDSGTFESGAARGLVYVFDYPQEKVVCVAEFFSENSAVVEFAAPKGASYGVGKMAISDDLQANILESAKRALYRTGAP